MMKKEILSPYLRVPQLDILKTFLGLESDSGTHPSMPGDIRSPSAKTSRSAPEHNSHRQISAMKRGGQRGYTHHVPTTHTHIHAHARQIDTHTHTHAGDVFSRDRPDVLSQCVCVRVLRSL